MDARIRHLPFDAATLVGLSGRLIESHHQNNDAGAVKRWREEFVALGKAQGGGSGWVLLMFQPREGTLVNQWAADHTRALAVSQHDASGATLINVRRAGVYADGPKW